VIKKYIKKPFLSFSTFVLLFICLFANISKSQDLQDNIILQPQGLEHTGIYSLKNIAPELTGEGVKYAVICRSFTYIDGEPQNDYRPFTLHNCFKSKTFGFYDHSEISSGVSPHSTAICSILFGEDPDAFYPDTGAFIYEGTTPNAQADIYEFWYFISNYVFDHSPPDADIITIAFGNQFEHWWTRGIESLVEHYGLNIIASIGNGTDSHDPVLYPAAGSNVIGVGVVNSVNSDNQAINLSNFSIVYPENSSIGPTANGQCKPDIVAPGNCLAADIFEPNQYEPTGNWSSFATPLVAGAAGLLVQKAKLEPDLSMAVSPYGGNCVIKAILMNSATKLPYWHKGFLSTDDDHTAPLDYIQGAGMLNALSAYEHLISGQQKPGNVSAIGWDLNQLNNNVTYEKIYKFSLSESDNKIITATLTWNKNFSNVYPFESLPEKDNNLRLELWAVDLMNPTNNYLLDYSDSSIDNVEHIHTAADPNFTNYEVIISISNNDDQKAINTIQRYGLAWNASIKGEEDSLFWYDLNSDGVVDSSDYAIVMVNLLNSPESFENYVFGDVNPDGVINTSDIEMFLENNNRQADWYIKNN